MRKVRWGSILLGLMMLLTLLTVTAFAAETTVAATDNAAANGQALVDAVSQASEGDTIVISAGTYDLPKNTYVRFYWIGSLAMGDFCAEKTAATMGAPGTQNAENGAEIQPQHNYSIMKARKRQ